MIYVITCVKCKQQLTGADLGGGCRGCAPLPEMTYGFLKQLVFCKLCGLLVLVTPFLSGAPPSKKDPGSAPDARISSGGNGFLKREGCCTKRCPKMFKMALSEFLVGSEPLTRKTLQVLLRFSWEDQTTVLPDGELTRNVIIELFFVNVDFFL